MPTIEPGMAVLARTAFGDELPKIATSGVVYGRDFHVVWVSREADWQEATARGEEPIADPWPAEDVRPTSPTEPQPPSAQSPHDAPA